MSQISNNLATLADEAEIRSLHVLYAQRFDARDADGYAELFTDDTIVTTPWGQIIHGRDKMRKAVLNTPAGKGWHRPGEARIQIDGDTATGDCAYLAQDLNGDVCRGRYLDVYRRTAEGWRIAERTVIIDERTPGSMQDA